MSRNEGLAALGAVPKLRPMTRPILLIALAAMASAAPAAPAVTSAYTKVDLERCKEIERRDEEASSAVWRCSGYRGVPFYVELGDERIDIDAGLRDKDELWSNTFDQTPATVEWRLNGGKPFAIIYRLTVSNSDRPKTSRLIVETIGRRDQARLPDRRHSRRDARRQWSRAPRRRQDPERHRDLHPALSICASTNRTG